MLPQPLPGSEGLAWSTLIETPQGVGTVVPWLARSGRFITLDTEATGLDPMRATPLLLQLGNWDGEVVIINLTARNVSGALSPLLDELSRHCIVGHNLNYDYRLLKSHYPRTRFTDLYDTQLVEQVLTCGYYDQKGNWKSQLSLASLAAKYLGVELDKSVRMTFTDSVKIEECGGWEPTQEQLAYAARDVSILPEIVEKQMAKLKEFDLGRAAQLRLRALVPLAEVESRGMLIDQTSWREFLSEIDRELAHVETDLRILLQPAETAYRLEKFEQEVAAHQAWEQARDDALAGFRDAWEIEDHALMPWGKYKNAMMAGWRELHPNPGKPHLDTSPVNLNSDVQIKRGYQALGLTVAKTDKATREKLLLTELSREQLQFVQLHTRQSILSHAVNSFGENVLARIVPETGRLHTHLNIGLTETGRMSSEKPSFQNMPSNPKLRHSFIADPGTYVITADFSGQELAIAAALSQCKQMIEDLNEGRDLYKELAVMVWGGTVDTITKEQRKKAKNGLLGINYGLSAAGLANRNNIPRREADAIIAAIRTRYHELVAWGDRQGFFAKQHGYVETISGAKRFFPRIEEMGWKVDTETRNAPIQGSAADIIYRCADRMEHTAVPRGIRPVNYVHDEVVSLVDNSVPVAHAAEIIFNEMTGAFYDFFPFERYGVRVGVDLHAGPYWTKE